MASLEPRADLVETGWKGPRAHEVTPLPCRRAHAHAYQPQTASPTQVCTAGTGYICPALSSCSALSTVLLWVTRSAKPPVTDGDDDEDGNGLNLFLSQFFHFILYFTLATAIWATWVK